VKNDVVFNGEKSLPGWRSWSVFAELPDDCRLSVRVDGGGDLTRSRPLISPLGLPIYVARFPSAPFTSWNYIEFAQLLQY
jgi:ABC-type glycerol-3-phosphate transport system permease component